MMKKEGRERTSWGISHSCKSVPLIILDPLLNRKPIEKNTAGTLPEKRSAYISNPATRAENAKKMGQN